MTPEGKIALQTEVRSRSEVLKVAFKEPPAPYNGRQKHDHISDICSCRHIHQETCLQFRFVPCSQWHVSGTRSELVSLLSRLSTHWLNQFRHNAESQMPQIIRMECVIKRR